MTIAGYQVSVATAALGGVALLWMLTLLVGAVSWEKPKKGRVRQTDLFVLVMSLIAGTIWIFALMPRTAATPVLSSAARARTGTCALIAPGDTDAKVRERMGQPDEIRSEEETRGPASHVWIYSDSRCAVHFFGNRVESIE
jgi:hypothetical protein